MRLRGSVQPLVAEGIDMVKLRESWRNVKIGAEFHFLTVLGQHFRTRNNIGDTFWSCVVECKCGNVKVVSVSDLPRGFQMSCGCHRVAVGIKNGKSRKRHGETGTTLHNLWHLIKLRCTDTCQKNYALYGGRGVTIHPEWYESYEVFRDYALANGYRPGLQADRYPDVDGNYEPGNVRFVTCKENSRNRRNTPFVTAFGETKCVMEWSEDSRCKVSFKTLYSRLTGSRGKVKWNPEAAISTPSLPRGLARRTLSQHLTGTGNDIKTIYEVRGLTPRSNE